jgi:2-keto-4-pentenoate hydratase/2-oxohepta-3-ene-1,7-dioic acid hydratase in catechol pathway
MAIRPANTLADPSRPVRVPEGVSSLAVWPCLVAVIDRPACRVPAASALEHVGGWSLALDFSVPLSNWHRPAIRQKCHDGFCKLMPVMRPADSLARGERIPSLNGSRMLIEAEPTATAANSATVVQSVAAAHAGLALRPDIETGQTTDEAELASPRWHRDPATFLAAVSQFMTLHRGDCMLFPFVDKPLQVVTGQMLSLDVPNLACWQVRLEAAS